MGLKELFTPVPSIQVEELKKFIKKKRAGTYTLLDVRQPREYERGHIPGATSIPLR